MIVKTDGSFAALINIAPTDSEQPLAPHYLGQPPARQLGQHVAVEEHSEDDSLVTIIPIIIISIIVIVLSSPAPSHSS